MKEKKINYDELKSILESEGKSSFKKVSILLVLFEIIMVLVSIFAINGSLILPLALFPFCVLGIIVIYLKPKKVVKRLEQYKDEINEYCIINDDSAIYDYIYTKYRIIELESNHLLNHELLFSDIISARDYSFNDEGIEYKKTEIVLNNDKKITISQSDIITKALSKYYSKEEKELDKTPSFTHDKYGKVEYIEPKEFYGKIVTQFICGDIEVSISFPPERLDDFMHDESLKRIMLDKIIEYDKKHNLEFKKKLVNKNIDVLLIWLENDINNNESNPLYTKNKSTEQLKTAIIDNQDLIISGISFDKNFNITSSNYFMDFGSFAFNFQFDEHFENTYCDAA